MQRIAVVVAMLALDGIKTLHEVAGKVDITKLAALK
jgi:hypothetical protein